MGNEFEAQLRKRFEQIEHLTSRQTERGDNAPYRDKVVQDQWLNFRAGAAQALFLVNQHTTR